MQSMSNNGGKKKGLVFNEINITPLTDIFLVLLIIMMVVAPMMQESRADIKPPGISSTGTPIEQGKLTVEVTAEGKYYLEGREIPKDSLTQELEKHYGKVKEKNVVIRADKKARSGAVITVMEAARDAKYEKVTVAGEALSKDRQKELHSSGSPSEKSSSSTNPSNPSGIPIGEEQPR